MKIPDYCVHNEKEIKGFFGPYRFLSNFYGSRVWLGIGGKNFLSVENAYQFAKFHPESVEDYLRAYDKVRMMTVREAKKWGNTIKLRSNWGKVKFDVMKQLVMDKFSRNLQLRNSLLETGDAYLEESNQWHDNEWGVCVCTPCRVSNVSCGGRNNLGKILMKVRDFWK